ncbi:MAG: hypothetical protein M5T52_18300 [Ignavibacteriaceae bacterium]|nr:hypothetical protein [Ignavibacteriaceae bacterium]
MPESGKQSAKVFILTGEWQDIRGRNNLKFIGTSDDLGTVEINFSNNPVFLLRINQKFHTSQFILKGSKSNLKILMIKMLMLYTSTHKVI